LPKIPRAGAKETALTPSGYYSFFIFLFQRMFSIHKKICTAALLAVFFIWPDWSLAQVKINEFLSDPEGSKDTGLEWIELSNISAQTIDLTGWQLNAASGQYFIFPPFSLGPNAYMLVRWRAEGQNSASELFTGIKIETNMGNSSGFIALFKNGFDPKNKQDAKNKIVDYIEYGQAGKTWESSAKDAGIWQAGQFIAAPQQGQSAGFYSGKWEIFSQPTPNKENALYSTTDFSDPAEESNEEESNESIPDSIQNGIKNYSDKIFINEFMAWPASGPEWVELVNSGSEPIDLSGWQIDDEPEESRSQKIGSGTLIEPGALLLIELQKNILNNEGDSVRLLWPDSQLVHAIAYEKALKGKSCSRFENNWLWTNPTPGAENIKSGPRTPNGAPEPEKPLLDPLMQTAAAGQASAPKENPEIPEKEKEPQTKNFSAAIAPPVASQMPDKKSSLPQIAALLVFACLAAAGFIFWKHKRLN
jgi:hypothetical protein